MYDNAATEEFDTLSIFFDCRLTFVAFDGSQLIIEIHSSIVAQTPALLAREVVTLAHITVFAT